MLALKLLLLFSFVFHVCLGHWDEKFSNSNTFTTVTDLTGYNAKLTPSTSKIGFDSEWINITVTGVPNPVSSDCLALYIAGPSVTERAPVKIKYLNDANYLATGSTVTSLHLINMMEDYVIRLFRFDQTSVGLLAQSTVIQVTNKEGPRYGHLALTNSPTEMRITWSSRSKGHPNVRWGEAPGEYPYKITADSTTYTQTDLCGWPANSYGYKSPGWIHTAVMKYLIPGQVYHYQYGSDEAGWSSDSQFVAGSSKYVSFVAFADMGKWDTDGSSGRRDDRASVDVSRHLRSVADQSDFMLLFGDVSYSFGFLTQWDEYLHSIEPVARRVPIMTSIGNHEYDGGECALPYRKFFNMPGSETWYSFNYGDVHVLNINSEVSFKADSPQYNFIKNDLSSVDRSATPWVIVTSHSPLYVDTKDEPFPMQEKAKSLRTELEDVFASNNVTLVLTGHHHSYQRTCPLYKGKCYEKGYPIHFVIGTGGSGLLYNFLDVTPDWIEYRTGADHGYAIISTDENSLSLIFMSVTQDRIIDRLKIKK